MFSLLAAINGTAIIHSVIALIVFGVIFGFLLWLVDYAEIKQPFNKGIKIFLVICAVIIVINALLSLIGRPFINW